MIVKAFYLGLEDLTQYKTGGKNKEKKVLLASKRSFWVHQSFQELNQIFAPLLLIKEQRG